MKIKAIILMLIAVGALLGCKPQADSGATGSAPSSASEAPAAPAAPAAPSMPATNTPPPQP